MKPSLYPGNTRCVLFAIRFNVNVQVVCCREKSERKPEVSLNQKVKNLIQKLGEAIHESVSESEHIAGVVKNIREQGFDVLLMLEATIGLNEVEPETEPSGPLQLTAGEPAEGPFTNNDLHFLKSLRISLQEDQE